MASATHHEDKRHADTAKLLVKHGAQVTKRDWLGNTPLHIASKNPHTNKQFVQTLIELGADVDAVNDSGQTPLHFAAAQGTIDTAKALLDAGANLNAEDNKGRQPVDIAVINDRIDWYGAIHH